jgi:HNH endonuclease
MEIGSENGEEKDRESEAQRQAQERIYGPVTRGGPGDAGRVEVCEPASLHTGIAPRARSPIRSTQGVFTEWGEVGVRYAPIPGRDGYLAGDDGSIWSLRGKRPLKRKPGWATKNRDRAYICFSPNVQVQVAHLILFAFWGPRPVGLECCHNDGDSSNNRPDNLRWDTRASNIEDNHTHGIYERLQSKKGEKNGNAKMSAENVLRVMDLHRKGWGPKRIGEEMAIPIAHISAIIHGKIWSSVTGVPHKKYLRKKKSKNS